MTTRCLHRPIRLLVVNPNSSQHMTRGIEDALEVARVSDTTETYTFTAPAQSPASINNDEDIAVSCNAVDESLIRAGELHKYDGVLVACFSVHPLVGMLGKEEGSQGPLATTGIFEASILASLSLLKSPFGAVGTPQTWGIVTTGKFWEDHLAEGVRTFLGQDRQSPNVLFAGVESTGLDASDFHAGVGPDVIETRLKEATKRLLGRGNVQCVVMGCAGMAGLEGIIRRAAVDMYGEEIGGRLFIIDGVKAGISLLEQMVRNKRMFQR